MRQWIICGAIFGFLGVATGAFGAHGLQSMFADVDPFEAQRQIEIFKTGARYALIHGVLLIGVALLSAQQPSKKLRISGWAFVLGTAIFSSTLWLLVLTGQKWLGAITPIGGLTLLVGWFFLGLAALTHK